MRVQDKLGLIAAWGMLLLTVELIAHASQDSSDKAERNAKIRADYHALTDSLEKMLTHTSYCTASLRGARVSEPIDVKDPTDSSRILAAVGDYHEIGYTITRLELKNVMSLPGSPSVRRGELHIEIKKEMASAVGAPIFTRKIAEIVFESNQDQIQRCLNKG